MKVIMLLGRSTGGIGTHVAQLSADLRDAGVHLIVVTHPLTAASFEVGTARLWWPGSAGPARAVRDFGRLRRLAGASDIVHAHGHQAGLLATLVTVSLVSARALGRRPKLIVSQHNAVLEGSGRQGLKRLAQRWVNRHADLVTGASSDLVAQALRFGARLAALAEVPSPQVPHLLAQQPADVQTRAQIRQSLFASLVGEDLADLGDRGDRGDLGDQRDPAVPLVLTVSRIADQKNLPMLVQAAARLSRHCIWVVIGDGDPRLLDLLREQASNLGAPVLFVGARRDADQWLRAAEVFVLSSEWEARALVVQEAMAAGTPVVATDVGGLHDLVSGTGLLVIPGDAGAIAKATDSILADPGLRDDLAARGREVAEALPDGPDTASRWLAWYSETLLMT